MKKIIFVLMVAVSLVFVSCNAPTKVKTLSAGGVESATTYDFNDFFNIEEIVHVSRDEVSTAIIVDKNTGVLYVYKHSGYQFGISPIYDSDGSVLTYDKWFAEHIEGKENKKYE